MAVEQEPAAVEGKFFRGTVGAWCSNPLQCNLHDTRPTIALVLQNNAS